MSAATSEKKTEYSGTTSVSTTVSASQPVSTTASAPSTFDFTTLQSKRQQKKVIDKLKNAMSHGHPVYSFEFFPPKTNAGIVNLRHRVSRMAEYDPIFINLTYNKTAKTIELAEDLLNNIPVDIIVHLSMTDMTKRELLKFLDRCKTIGIRNILALRGDPPRGADTWEPIEDGFEHAADLVRLIRKEYGDYFSVGVGGYPDGHQDCISLEEDLTYLKQKVDAGADFVVSLLFYDTKRFLDFKDRANKAGIKCPIVPGLMPIQTYNTFVRIASFSNVQVPDTIWSTLETLRDDDAKVKEFGINHCLQQCKELLDNGVNTLHFYTFNLERSVTITLERLNLLVKDDSNEYPWRPAVCAHRRKKEGVRPIFWSNRDTSYIRRTQHWDEYPNGRWGDDTSPAFGELPNHHLLAHQKQLTTKDRLKMWGSELKSICDISAVFINYLDMRIGKLPWCFDEIRAETSTYIIDALRVMNEHEFLTINSQPQINGVPSDDPIVGWGHNSGYVYQKAYLEFFCSKENLDKLLQYSKKYPSLTYMAVNCSNDYISNMEMSAGANALTWGVFPCSEILQPTIVDPRSFIVWKDEAFDLWKSYWQSIYATDSHSYQLIDTIRDQWYLVNIVENDFVKGDVFAPFRDLIRDKMGDNRYNRIGLDAILKTYHHDRKSVICLSNSMSQTTTDDHGS